MGSIDKALPHAGFYPDSQNFHPDAAKIRTLFETSNYFCRNLHNTPKLLFSRTQIIHAQSSDIEIIPYFQSKIVTAKSIKKQRFQPYAFSEIGVAMLSSVLKSEVAIQANRKIMKTFVAYRHLAELPLAATYLDLRKQIEGLRQEMDDILADQNDINESTRAQLDAISTALAELQAKNPEEDKPRRPIGFIQPDNDEN
jgi:hypothetical protein